MRSKILDTFQEWVYFSKNDPSSRDQLIKNSCLELALAGLYDSGLASTSKECLRHLMKNAKQAEEWPELFELIYAHLPDYCKK